jgi:hypothetical protein
MPLAYRVPFIPSETFVDKTRTAPTYGRRESRSSYGYSFRCGDNSHAGRRESIGPASGVDAEHHRAEGLDAQRDFGPGAFYKIGPERNEGE